MAQFMSTLIIYTMQDEHGAYLIFELPHEKTNNLHMQKQRHRSASRSPLISAFVFTTRIVQFLYFLNPKFPVSSRLLCLYSPVCVRPVWKPHCWFSHEAAHFLNFWNNFAYPYDKEQHCYS